MTVQEIKLPFIMNIENDVQYLSFFNLQYGALLPRKDIEMAHTLPTSIDKYFTYGVSCSRSVSVMWVAALFINADRFRRYSR